jgi:phosphoribosylaminoimidazolecarboxamide formyltransferase/IMP cyclohydrolase
MIKIKSALVSVYSKEGLEPVIRELHGLGVHLYSTGGTQTYIEELGIPVTAVEELTSYPSILDGRVKTLHPKVFGGLLARREEGHLKQLEEYDIPELDCVIVDLYPFEATLASTNDEATIIEKIDIGGISLIRAAAKNFNDVVVVPSKDEYPMFLEILKENQGFTKLSERKEFARRAFNVSSHYDTAIFHYFNRENLDPVFKYSILSGETLRYGENPHQKAMFLGDLSGMFDILNGKALSYNNLVDIDAAVQLIMEFKEWDPTFAILKHTNACGVATRVTLTEAWKDALAADPVSAFGGVLICNTKVDLATATEINQLFYEVLVAPDYDKDALELLCSKKQRILLKLKSWQVQTVSFKTLLNGVIQQDTDLKSETEADLRVVTEKKPTPQEIADLLYANKCVKHLKSNGIAIVKNQQLLTMGCGQTSRVDALQHAIEKAQHFGFDLNGSVMASEAFFPFPDCVEIGNNAGIKAVIQPGGSVKDQLSIDFCNTHDIAMVMTGFRHFKH